MNDDKAVILPFDKLRTTLNQLYYLVLKWDSYLIPVPNERFGVELD